MPALPSYFEEFLLNIRPSDPEREAMRDAHRELREKVQADADLKTIVIADFLQGSHRRHTDHTAVNGKRSDVDVVLVTTLDESQYPDPTQALLRFAPFLERNYRGRWGLQGRSIEIKLDGVKLDMVPTSAPSEAVQEAIRSLEVQKLYDWEAKSLEPLYESLQKSARAGGWQAEPLRIPNRDANRWEDTHPLEQIRWTIGKNQSCDGHFVNVARGLKWWRHVNYPQQKYPKGYPWEHMIGDCCPNGIGSIAEGVTLALEGIRENYREHRQFGTKPKLFDRGVPYNDVWERITVPEFSAVYDQASAAADLARYALNLPQDQLAEAIVTWQKLFGSEFPNLRTGGSSSSGSGQTGGFTQRAAVAVPTRPRRYA